MKRDLLLSKREQERNSEEGVKYAYPKRAIGGKTLGALLPRVTYVAFKKNSPLFVKIIMDWEHFVGVKLAQQTAPRRLHLGTLTIACSGPIAMEIRYNSLQILERINVACGLYGTSRLQNLKLIQDQTLKAPMTVKPKEPIESVAIEAIENDELKTVLERLGGHIKAREKRALNLSKDK